MDSSVHHRLASG